MIKLNPINNIITLNLSDFLDAIPAKDFDDFAKEIADYQSEVCGYFFELDFNFLDLLISVLGSHTSNRFCYGRLVKAYGLDWRDCFDYYDTIKRHFSGENLKSVLVECLQFISSYLYEVGTIEQYKSFCGYINGLIEGTEPGLWTINNERRAFEVVRYILGYAFILQRYDAQYNNSLGKYHAEDYQIESKSDGTFYYQPALFETSRYADRYLKNDFLKQLTTFKKQGAHLMVGSYQKVLIRVSFDKGVYPCFNFDV